MRRTKYTPSQLFKEEHLNLIRKIAWSFHRTTGLDFEELFHEACYHYCRGCNQFQEGQGEKLTTYVFPVIQSGLIDFIAKEREWVGQKAVLIQEGGSTPVYEYWSDLTGDILEVIDFILENDEEIAKLTPKRARGVVRDHLRDQGWTWPRIWEAIRKTKKTLNETEIGGIIYMNEDT